MATIVKRPSGKWQAQVLVHGTRRSKTFDKRADAKRWAASESLEPNAESDMSLGDLLDWWLSFREPELAFSTHSKTSHHIEAYLKPAIGGLPATVSPAQLNLAARRVCGVDGSELSIASLHRIIGVLKAACASAVRNDLIRKDPCRTLRLPPKPPTPIRPPDDDHLIQFLTELSNAAANANDSDTNPLRLLILLRLAIITGARRGELAALTYKDFQDGKVQITRSAFDDPTGSIVKIKATKTGSKRVVEVDEETYELVHELLVGDEFDSSQRLFPWSVSTMGRKLAHASRRTHIDQAMEDWDVFNPRPNHSDDRKSWGQHRRSYKRAVTANAPRITFTQLRHRAAVELLEDFPVNQVARLLGHSSPNVTLRVYAREDHAVTGTAKTLRVFEHF